jgi:hypothetical protein
MKKDTFEYLVNRPVKFISHFSIKKDNSQWNGGYLNVDPGPPPVIPDRKKTLKLNEVFKSTTDYSKKFCNSGLYLLFFKNIKVYYVGIASLHTRNPEGIESRIKKHIAKINGSNLGIGVAHTTKWREFAIKIYKDCKTRKKEYGFEDLFLVTINIKNHHLYKGLLPNEDKKRLEYVERELSNPENTVIQEIINFLGENQPQKWISFNHTSQGKKHNYKFTMWA